MPGTTTKRLCRPLFITPEDRERCVRIWQAKNPNTPIPDWWRPTPEPPIADEMTKTILDPKP